MSRKDAEKRLLDLSTQAIEAHGGNAGKAKLQLSKAIRELGWEPRPVEDSIREAARFWAGLRDAKRKSKTA